MKINRNEFAYIQAKNYLETNKQCFCHLEKVHNKLFYRHPFNLNSFSLVRLLKQSKTITNIMDFNYKQFNRWFNLWRK